MLNFIELRTLASLPPHCLKDQCLQVLAVHLLRVLGWSYAIFCF